MNREEILEQRKKWYSNDFVLYEIIKSLKNKELCFLPDKSVRYIEKKKMRYGYAQKVEYLKNQYFPNTNFFKYLTNIYNSVALYDFIPPFTFNFKLRVQTEEYKGFKENAINHIIGFDFFVDFDGENSYNEAKQFKEILDNYKIPYYIVNSSFKGIHFIINYEYLPHKKIDILIDDIKSIMLNIKKIYDFNSIDMAVYHLDRVRKTPYSYVCDGSICLPLSDEQFKNLNQEILKMDYILKNIKIFNRGLLIRTFGLSKEQLKENVKIFWSDFIQ